MALGKKKFIYETKDEDGDVLKIEFRQPSPKEEAEFKKTWYVLSGSEGDARKDASQAVLDDIISFFDLLAEKISGVYVDPVTSEKKQFSESSPIPQSVFESICNELGVVKPYKLCDIIPINIKEDAILKTFVNKKQNDKDANLEKKSSKRSS